MGIALAFLVACIDAVNNVFVKKGTTTFSVMTVTWAWQAFSLLVLVPIAILNGIPPLDQTFFIFSFIKITIYVGTLLLYSTALKLADISQTVPMLAFSPLITILVSYLLIKEIPSHGAFLGIILIIAGAYWANASKDRKGLFAPLKAIFENKGVLSMFLVGLLWGVTGSLDKITVTHSSPIFSATFGAIIITLVFTPMVLAQHKREFFKLFRKENLAKLAPIGMLDGLLMFTQMTAINLTLASYAIAIKRSSILVSSILGYVVFKEDISKRILPIALMFIGVLLIFLTN